ncbi:hypothetical protein M409DRAFT_53972 [Zasmidium cellare ATCC 36951]|uniref:C2H2-type domain-containing protein n=1 Tax=Zasmidium cellare ATCC 36951 TaxID=1080233 RepID=A0A6A6CJF5_ZASCE|nr:uncharacterized protein M409DRAFT_53972 [Zasmidium cellare ATCC 36951]KAF2167367.1 hypothetical protein M409DRAFT_53972 [Zasmidium cellare ATCC 36951]
MDINEITASQGTNVGQRDSTDSEATIQADHIPEPTASSRNCSLQSIDQKLQFQRSVIARTGPPFSCPLCAQTFQLKKTLIRHAKDSIANLEGSPFVCSIFDCGLRFKRKDILSRHMKSQHSAGRTLVQCPVCSQEVRPRSLKGHQATQACANARPSAATSSDQVVPTASQSDDSKEAFYSLHSYLHDILDCVLLTAWLFTTVKPWGPGEMTPALWFVQAQPPRSYEVEKLKCLFLKTLKTAVEAPDISWNGHLLDAIAIIKVITTMTEGWKYSNPHSDAYKRLAEIQIRRLSLTKDAFINSQRSQAWDSVLNQTVPENDRPKCVNIVKLILGVMRKATWDSVSRLTEDFSKPLEDAAIKAHTRSFTTMAFFQGYGSDIIEIANTAVSMH